ncbi:hypothetical protein MAA_11446 [Metarhizium robertsii ARSEF 23]|uniref:Uncharacterized protein n=1 Tax=Metarhizium robertsii (strain ARSEF 23 / ATCC MYA-3075) TaxID=655844 RepID=A0A0B2XFW2_METRA|nr:uncharacterized protein MAA_11446 [Metarhizium robertsii ARSEF 23]KHO10909.1 hypothetical protein MAA_11446 [Metarhizium robertsii ARSEF 23]
MEVAPSMNFSGEGTSQPQPQAYDLDKIISDCSIDMPQLSFDCSTAPSSLSSVNSSGNEFDELKLNPEAPSFPYYDPWTTVDPTQVSHYGGHSSCNQADLYGGFTTNEELKWILVGLASKVDAINAAIGVTNARITSVEGKLDSIFNELPRTERTLEAIDELKVSVKEFSKALITQLFGSVDVGTPETV